MSAVPPRRPSTLAVDNFRAASRPLGAPLGGVPPVRPPGAPVIGTARADRPPAREPAGKVPLLARAPARPLPKPSGSPTPSPATSAARPRPAPAAARERRDGLLVTSVVIAFILVALILGSIEVSGNMRVDQSRTALSGTLAAVHQRQTEFRILNRRFATWTELEARGVSLPPRQRVVGANATASHWFLSLRDRDTGVICSRTGELFDDSPVDRTPTCTPGAP